MEWETLADADDIGVGQSAADRGDCLLTDRGSVFACVGSPFTSMSREVNLVGDHAGIAIAVIDGLQAFLRLWGVA